MSLVEGGEGKGGIGQVQNHLPSLRTSGHTGIAVSVPELTLNRKIHTQWCVALFFPVGDVPFL